MQEIDLEAFSFAITKIEDGFLFEDFGKAFLSAIFGHTFIPVGESKDKGIDAFIHVFSREDRVTNIFQFSTESDFESKIQKTIDTLNRYKIHFDQLFYVTNRKINNNEIISSQLSDLNNKSIIIYDNIWLKMHANYSEVTINSYNIFVDSNLHAFIKHGNNVVIANLDKDARIYVYLREQLENKGEEKKLDEVLADSLILFVLEGTNPDLNILKSRDQIKLEIKKYVKFNPVSFNDIIDRRLNDLSIKPRKIKFHTVKNGYTLPYETRCNIRDRDIKDEGLFETFLIQTEDQLSHFLHDENVNVKNLANLIERTIREIYYQQGLEFANFIVNGESKNVIEKDLMEIISTTVERAPIIIKNKEKVKVALLTTIRNIVYNGTIEQKHYFKCLSNTYMMMFMLQYDPKLTLYFQSLASNLNIYVCTSLIIPALSEIFLEKENKRHWNLLKSSYQAGISLYVNETIIKELVSHFYMISNKYKDLYSFNENIFIDNEIETLYIEEILIRAYFYAKREKHTNSFHDFINNFLDPSLKSASDDLISYLKEVFGIQYVPDSNLNIEINQQDILILTDKLKHYKSQEVAENDAKLILTIYKLREKNNESGESSIFGYKTWWLSKDTTTYRAIIDAFGEKRFPVSCYIRPDFIYNYITLKPSKDEVDETYDKLFPSMLGVNISYHLPPDIAEVVQIRLKEHKDKPPDRLKAIIRQLSDKLKTDPNIRNKRSVKLFLDEQLALLNNNR